jgi:hypothetical protein
MSETQTETVETVETPEAAAEAAAAPAEAEAEAQTQGVFHRIREAGEAGKQEWEQVIAHAREVVTRQSTSLYTHAQARGASLLLGALGRLRKAVEGLEAGIRDARQPEAEATPTPTAA